MKTPEPRARPFAHKGLEDWLVFAAIALLCAVALWMRWERLGFAPDSDEVGTVPSTFSWMGILRDDETAVNPPLWRWLSVGAKPLEAIARGRMLSLAAGVASVPLAWGAAAHLIPKDRAWARPLAGVFLASLVAVHPWLISASVHNRVYGTWVALSFALMLCLGARARAVTWIMAALSVLLCWLHYLAFPLLVAAGLVAALERGYGRAAALWAGPASLFVLVAQIFGPSINRVAPMQAYGGGDLVRRFFSFDLIVPHVFVEGWPGRWQSAWFGGVVDSSKQLAFVALLCVLAVVCLHKRFSSHMPRVLAGAFGLFAGALVVSQVQYVRPNIAVLVISWFVPVVAVSFAAFRSSRLALAGFGVLTWLFFSALPDRCLTHLGLLEAQRGADTLFERLPTWSELRGDDPVIVWPSFALTVVWTMATDRPPAAMRGGDASCGGWAPCENLGGVPFTAVRDPVDGTKIDGIVVALGLDSPAGVRDHCTLFSRAAGMSAFACGRTAVRLENVPLPTEIR